MTIKTKEHFILPKHLRTIGRHVNLKDKNDTMVKITLPKDNTTIIASKYQLYLPTEKQLIDEVMKEVNKKRHK